jgi:polysaccharide biosynthesis protein PslA
MTIGEREAVRAVPTASVGNRGSSIGSGVMAANEMPGLPRDRRKPANERRAPVNLRAIEAETPPPTRRRYAGPRLSPLLMRALFLGGQNLAIVATGAVLEIIYEAGPSTSHIARHVPMALGTIATFSLIRFLMGPDEFEHRANPSHWLLKSFLAMGLAELAAIGGYNLLVNWPLGIITDVGIGSWASAWFLSSALAMAAAGGLFRALTSRWRREGRFAKRIVVFGGGEHGARFIGEAVQRGGDDIAVRAYFDDRQGAGHRPIAGVPCLGNSDRLIEYVRRQKVDEIVIALPWSADERIIGILSRLRHVPVPVRLSPEIIVLRTHGLDRPLRPVETPIIRNRPISEWDLFLKDVFDRATAAVLLLLALPVMLVAGLAIKLDSPGPVLFRQKRLGFNGRPFNVLKFRTMTPAREASATARQASRMDRRVTRVGRFLRRSSIDELPQLINVLLGDLSLVGPRPHPMWQSAADLWPEQGDRPLDAILTEYASRHRVKPGITGWAQVCGYRGETETVDKMAKRVEYDLHYIDNWSLWLDVKILLLTIVTTVAGKNAY